MWLKMFLLFCILYNVSGIHVQNEASDEYPPLQWPKKFSVDATKYYLTSGWVEDFKYWRSLKSSRLEKNHGSVIKIARSSKGFAAKGHRYELHPETTEEATNKMTCTKKIGSIYEPIIPDTIMPSVWDLKMIGEDTVKGVECIKFVNEDDTDEDKRYLWAIFDNATSTWSPLRYEEKEMNTWHGYINNHIIWDFYNFKSEIEMSVFKLKDDSDCKLVPYIKEDNLLAIEELKFLDPEEESHLNHVFSSFKTKYAKDYVDEKEHAMRKKVFLDNWRLVVERNRQNLGYHLAITKLADRSEKELKMYKGLKRSPVRKSGNIPFPYTDEKIRDIAENLPPEYDLRLQGVIGPVLDQESCGSCWTFGTTGAVEGALARSNGGTLIKLSNQALLDCSWGFGNTGCEGGTDTDSYEWIKIHGLPTEEEYGPYVLAEDYCKIENMTKTYKIAGFTDVTHLSIDALKVAIVNHGPLSVSIHQSKAMELYSDGIFYDPDCKNGTMDLDHEVTLVGYGEKDGDTFWIIKNTRGPYWGIDGYLHISAQDNNCGVTTEPTYVTI